MESNRTCPECHLVFEAPLSETGVLACPPCNTVFAAAAPVVPVVTSAAPVASSRQMLRGVAAVGAVLCLAAGMGYAYHLLNGIDYKAATMSAPRSHAPPEPPSPPPVEYVPIIPAEPMPSATMPQQPRPSKLQPPAAVEKTERPLTLPERINAAIDRGRAYLQSSYHEFPQYYRNNLGLLGLTLLECGVAADDPSVRQIAARIRSQERQITQTYQLALAILFLDRLGDPRDRTLIRSFGQRLLWGQFDGGAWTNSCLVNDRQRARANLGFGHNPARQRITYQGDNSSTQFAVLGLWAARRHGLSVSSALLAAEQYFRNTQNDDGSWALRPKASIRRDSMTCAGLMSLAMSHGVSAGQGRDIRLKRPIVVHDAAIHRGLRYLAQSLDNMTVAGNGTIRVQARSFLDFLWSLERMAVIYDLKKIGEREWYPWAAQRLVDKQWGDGRFSGTGNLYESTCLALLVLKRGNFAKDLQLAVQEQPSPLLPEITGRTILQRSDAFWGQTRKRLTTSPRN